MTFWTIAWIKIHQRSVKWVKFPKHPRTGSYAILKITTIVTWVMHDELKENCLPSLLTRHQTFCLCTQKVIRIAGSFLAAYILSSSQLEKSFKVSSIHLCRQLSTASGIVNQLLVLVLCSGHDSSSSLTNRAYIAALHKPSGQHSSWCVLLLNW